MLPTPNHVRILRLQIAVVEYQRLLEASGFELTQIILTSCDVSIIEGRKIG